MKTYKGYKVVRRYEGELVSATQWGYPHWDYTHSVRYKPNQWTFPFWRCGPLAVFTDLDRAKSFLCLVGGPKRLEIWVCDWQPWPDPLPDIEGGKAYLWSHTKKIPRTEITRGTKLACAVRLQYPIDLAEAPESTKKVVGAA
ncbi:MAG: hypothetical protein ACUVWX_14760 [Kiritimatiellia bacterium]